MPVLTPEMNLILIGGRASGKTTVGKILARMLNRPFVDLDEILVGEAGCSIAELVAREGWPEFRRREKELVHRYCHLKGLVLAPGGGVVLDPENVACLRQNGLIIWLKATPEVLARRLQADPVSDASRPSLTGEDPAAEMARVLKEREPLYQAAAHVTVETSGLDLPQVVEQVRRLLQPGQDPV